MAGGRCRGARGESGLHGTARDGDGRADEVLARVAAGAGREIGDHLDLSERCLELFELVSRNGVSEVWLMGQRLLNLPSEQWRSSPDRGVRKV